MGGEPSMRFSSVSVRRVFRIASVATGSSNVHGRSDDVSDQSKQSVWRLLHSGCNSVRDRIFDGNGSSLRIDLIRLGLFRLFLFSWCKILPTASEN